MHCELSCVLSSVLSYCASLKLYSNWIMLCLHVLNVYSMLKHETLVLTLAALEKIEEKLARGYCNCCSFNLFKSSSFVMLSSMAFKGSAFFVDQNSSSLSLVGLGLDLKSRGEKS